jgi:hypothetical protein
MNECVNVTVNKRKVSILVLGCPVDFLLKNPSLIYEILKTIGHKMGLEYLKKINDLSDVSIVQDMPDFIVKVDKGEIKVLDFI